MGLNPEESMPKKMCFTGVSKIKEEIILSSTGPAILPANFCSVVKCGIFDTLDKLSLGIVLQSASL